LFVASLCGTPEIEAQRERVEVPIRNAELKALARSAPPMEGGEYISVDLLEAKWGELLEAWRSEVRAPSGTVQEILARKNSAWHVVGRVHFHLAENKRDQEYPFAFLASYTTGLSAQGNPQHRPLGQALRESSSVRDKSRLLALLLPVKNAAEKSGFLKESVDSGQIFQPLSWTRMTPLPNAASYFRLSARFACRELEGIAPTTAGARATPARSRSCGQLLPCQCRCLRIRRPQL